MKKIEFKNESDLFHFIEGGLFGLRRKERLLKKLAKAHHKEMARSIKEMSTHYSKDLKH